MQSPAPVEQHYQAGHKKGQLDTDLFETTKNNNLLLAVAFAYLAANVFFYIPGILTHHHRLQFIYKQSFVFFFQLLQVIAVHKLDVVGVVLADALFVRAVSVVYGDPVIGQC